MRHNEQLQVQQSAAACLLTPPSLFSIHTRECHGCLCVETLNIMDAFLCFSRIHMIEAWAY